MMDFYDIQFCSPTSPISTPTYFEFSFFPNYVCEAQLIMEMWPVLTYAQSTRSPIIKEN